MSALAALILYDYIITFENEVQLVWRHKAAIVDVLFYLNRYNTLLFGIINAASGYLREQEVSSTRRCHYVHTYTYFLAEVRYAHSCKRYN